MSSKKFLAVLAAMMFVFLVVFGAGCGGGGDSKGESGGGSSEDVSPDVSPDVVYLVSFDTDGGTPEVPTQKVKEGNYAIKPTEEITRNPGEFLEYWCEGSKTGSEFHFETTPIREDKMLYAKWSPVKDEDTKAVEKALEDIKAKFIWGTITQDGVIDLPSVDGVTLVWTSDTPTIIKIADSDISATVTRSTSTVTVNLTVKITLNGALKEWTWPISVIGTNAPTTKDSYATIYARWERFNSTNPDRRWEDVKGNINDNKGEPVKSIEGRFSDNYIRSAGDASYVLGEISSVLGLTDGATELVFKNRNIDTKGYGAEYAFVQQTAGGVRYYGRGVTLSVASNDKTDSLASSVYTDKIPTSGSDYSEAKASDDLGTLGIYENGFNLDGSEIVLYTLNEYAETPKYARLLNVSGTNADGVYFNDEVIIGSDGELIDKITNLHTETASATGTNEKNGSETFNVEKSGDKYLMYNAEYNFSVYAGTPDEGNLVTKSTATWEDAADKTNVSAYVNALKAMQYWRINFKRASIDGQDGEVKVVVAADSLGLFDNASWTSGQNILSIYPKSNDAYSYTRAVAVPTMVHETAHGVFEASVGLDFPYKGYTAAINEGYADIFACLQNRKWQIGEEYVAGGKCLRDIANPTSAIAIERASGDITVGGIGQDQDSHMASYLVSHAAYLMNQAGVDWSTLELLWYKSMSMGYSATSDFYDVRTCVVKAAKKLGLSASDIKKIKDVFDEEGITDYGAKLYGKVTDAADTSNVIANATVALTQNGVASESTSTDAYGKYSVEADVGIYDVQVSADGYVTFKKYNVELAPAATPDAETSGDVKLDVTLVKPSTPTTKGTLRFTAENATKPEIKVVGASVDVRQDWNNVKAEPIATGKTDANGYYAVSLDAGYYTVRVTSTDFYTPYTFTVAIKPEATMPSEKEIQMSPMFEIPEEERDNLSSFRVVLTWGLYPSDLDSHLTAKLSDDTYFHIAYYSRSGYDNGIRVASLDVDDVTSYGPETVSLTSFDKEGNYDYYVHWYSGSGSWAGSNAKVTLWLSNSETPTVFEVPTEGTDATTTSYGKKRYWHVFSIRNGVFTTINEIVSSPYTTPNAGDTNTRTRSVSGVKSEPQKTYYTDK